MLIGIDDTDSPAGMCTTYLGAVLARRLIREHMRVREARLVRINPNVTFKTRGNAAIMLDVVGAPDRAFTVACDLVEELADALSRLRAEKVAAFGKKEDVFKQFGLEPPEAVIALTVGEAHGDQRL